MISKPFKPPFPFPTRKAAFNILLFIILCLNGLHLCKEVRAMQKLSRLFADRSIGRAFTGFEEVLKNSSLAGYYTDKDLRQTRHSREFAEAQYVLAPVILDLNNVDHPYIIFNCLNEETAWRKIKEIGAIPVKKNSLGIILAKRHGN